MRNCPVCGTEVSDAARFCRHCGHAFSSPTTIGGTSDMKNFPPGDAQPVDVSRVPTGSLTHNNEKEWAQVGLPAGSTSSEKQPGASSQYSNGEDNGEQPEGASLADIPTTDVALGSGNDLPSDEGASMLQAAPHISEAPTLTVGDPSAKEGISQDEASPVASPSASGQAPSLESSSLLDDSASPVAPAEPPCPHGRRRGMSSGAKWLSIAIIALDLIAAGLGGLVVFLGPLSTGTGGTPGAVTSPSSITGTTPAASPCSGSTSPTCSATHTISTPAANKGSVDLTFAGAVAGRMTDSIVSTCGSEQSVAGGMQYHVALFGTVGGQQYALTFSVYPYTNPDTYTSSVFSFFGPAGGSSSITQWRSSPKLGVSVTINSDGKSGTLDIDYVSSTDNSTARIAGSWKCA